MHMPDWDLRKIMTMTLSYEMAYLNSNVRVIKQVRLVLWECEGERKPVCSEV